MYTLQILPAKYDSTIATPTVHHRIFYVIKDIDDSTVIISIDQIRIKHGEDISEGDNYKKFFKDWRICVMPPRGCTSPSSLNKLKRPPNLNMYPS